MKIDRLTAQERRVVRDALQALVPAVAVASRQRWLGRF